MRSGKNKIKVAEIELIEQLKSVQIGHVDIKKNNIGTVIIDELNSFNGTGGAGYHFYLTEKLSQQKYETF
jgi:hypothetical protein